MKATFKQFNSFVDLSDDQVSEEKLAEIFGWSEKEKEAKRKKALADLMAKRDALKQKQAANTAAQTAKQKEINAYTAKAKGNIARDMSKPSPLDNVPTSQMRGGQLRAAERDWAAGLANECFNPQNDNGVKGILQDLVSGNMNLMSVMNTPKTPAEKKAAKHLATRFDAIATENKLDAKKDADKIQKQIFAEVERFMKAHDKKMTK